MPDPEAPPIGVGLVGLGNSGRHYHLPHLRSDRRFALRAVATAGGGDPAEIGVPWHTGWVDLVGRPDVDLVVVATAHSLHHPVAAAALDAGKHVLVEKPLTVTPAQADDLVRRAAASGRILAVHSQRRWEADFVVLRDLVRRGAIGDPWRISATRGHQNDYISTALDRPHAGDRVLDWARSRAAGGGVLRVIGPHPIDHVLHLAGTPLRRVSARLSYAPGDEVERWAGIELEFGPTLTGRVEVFRRQGPPAPRFAVWGETGTAVAPDGLRVVVRPHDGPEYEVGGLTAPGVLGEEIYDDVFAAVREGRALRAGVADARAVVGVIDLAERSSRDGGAWVAASA